MEKGRTFEARNAFGEPVECEIIMSYYSYQNGNEYVFYTDNDYDEDGSLNLYASRYLGEEDDGEGNKTKIIRICRSFAESLWNSSETGKSLDGPTYVFDNCGFKVELDRLQEKFSSKIYIIPSEEFHNFTEFFDYIKIPFYEGYEIRIQNDTNDNCYNYSLFLKINLVYFISIFIFTYML